MIPSPIRHPQAGAAEGAKCLPQKAAHSVLAQLLHALYQPLTGLQCSMEVALARPRTAEQYASSLREGLELTGRMRILVEAIGEVSDADVDVDADVKGEKNEQKEVGWNTLLREVVDDLAPVAEVNRVHITLDCSDTSSIQVRAGRLRLATALFRLLESALSLAAGGSDLRIEAGGAAAEVWLRVRWSGGAPPGAFSRPELGLLVAQAGWERAGAQWERERIETLETVTIRLPGFSGGRKF
jgi:signal transduction histidine kinase